MAGDLRFERPVKRVNRRGGIDQWFSEGAPATLNAMKTVN